MNKIDELDLALIREKGWAYPPCPHCGKRDYVYANERCYGWAERQYDETGHFSDLELSRVFAVPSKTLRCCSCGKVRRDLVLKNGRICLKQGLTNSGSVV